ncbi:MAG: hypothetical protein IID46_00540, partial [Planctomycetes bacterium]|nr:hypothetical protein [Planctomycetota bacterium]
MTEIDLRDKFPDLEPVSGVPFLGTMMGCGFQFSGTRSQDQDTGSYVTNYCLFVLFVPLLILRSYRLIEADAGDVIIGREPVSDRARMWNVAVLALIAFMSVGFWWNHHTQTPEYIARRKLAEAAGLVEQGHLSDAARLYREVAVGPTELSSTAIEELAAMLE